MKAVWYTRQGPPGEVMQFGEQPTPHATAGEVRVRLHASAVNPADSNRCVGRSYAMEGALIIPNSDGSGVVDEVGAGVDAAWLGRRVWLYHTQRASAHNRISCNAYAWMVWCTPCPLSTLSRVSPTLTPRSNTLRRMVRSWSTARHELNE